jgi:hypothetical protein
MGRGMEKERLKEYLKSRGSKERIKLNSINRRRK